MLKATHFPPTDYSGTSFLATFDTDQVTPDDPIVFDYIVHNTGGHYDPTSGIYTTPIDGTYEFIVHIWSDNDVNLGAWLTVDGTGVSHATALYFDLKKKRFICSSVLRHEIV